MVVGSDEIDWQELRKHTNYQGEYWDRHPIIQWFWEVLINECTVQEKKNFLRFLTGCDRMPILGVTDVKAGYWSPLQNGYFQPLFFSQRLGLTAKASPMEPLRVENFSERITLPFTEPRRVP